MGSESPLLEEKVPAKFKFNLAMGGFANSFLNGFVFSNLTFYYTEKLGADPAKIGLAWMLFMIWNVVNDPLASYIIDNTRTKIGRRVPYIRWGSFIYGACFIFCWFPIASVGDDVGLFWNFFAALFLLDTCFTFVGCCFYSLPNEIAVTAKERASLTVYNVIASFINTGIGLLLPIMLLTGQVGIHPLFRPIMVGMGILSAGLLFLSSFFIKENMFAQMQPYEPFFKGIGLTFKNKPFWWFEISSFSFSFIVPLIMTGILYYIDYVIELTSYTSYTFIGTLFFGIILGLVFGVWTVKKLKPKKTLILVEILLAVAFLALFFVGRYVLIAAIPFLLVGIGFTGGNVAVAVVTGDCIDNDELITGKRREAIYGGVNALVVKPPLSIANWLFLFLIQAFGFRSPIENVSTGELFQFNQSELAKTGIMFAIFLIPAIFLIISAITMRKYNLDGPEWEKKKAEIIRMHQEKEKEYLRSLKK
jgi:GPH family glycoside/pentoside/hexuronide:cation symporter